MMRFRPVFALIPVLALVLGAVAAPAADSPTLRRMVDSGRLRIGLSGAQPPFNATDRNGELIGLEVDLGTLLTRAAGVEAEWVVRPFPELLQALTAGEVDLVMSGMAITADRTLGHTFVGPYMISGKSILTRSEALARVNAADELNRADLKLAALQDSTSQRFVERRLPKADLVRVRDYDAAVAMLVDGKVDALVADMPICILSVLRRPDAGLVTLAEPISIEPVGIAVPIDDPQFANLIDNYLDTFEQAGLLDALRRKWLEDGSWIAALP
jgi:ABC-type amino acid transport substrate-binding protein